MINSAPSSIRKFAPLWHHDPEHDVEDGTIDTRLQHMRLPAQVTANERDTLRLILSDFQPCLRQSNLYVREFEMACEIPNSEANHRRLIIHGNPIATQNVGEHLC